MSSAITAYWRALRSLTQPAILWHLVWPTIVALILWGAVAWLAWDWISLTLVQVFQDVDWLQWIASHWETSALAAVIFVKLVLVLLLIPLVYGTALFIVAVFALPFMLRRVAREDYADLEMRHGGTLAGSAWNAFVALVVFLVAWVVTLPLWFIPGVALFLPLILSAYLNQRAYRYDSLAEHADRNELREVIEREKGGLYLVGLVAGGLAYIPGINLVAPAYAGLAFVHYSLEALRRFRRREEAVKGAVASSQGA